MTSDLERLTSEIAACRVCAGQLPAHVAGGPRPVVRLSATARLCIAGQAPGARVHDSGVPFTDRSGDRLRAWMGVDATTFYDQRRIAIVPMGFCFPGNDAKGGDLPPRPECAPLWRARVFAAMPQVECLLLVGGYAQDWTLKDQRAVSERVRDFRSYGPRHFPLPHPSWRNTGWIKRNPWFEDEVLPALRQRVADLI